MIREARRFEKQRGLPETGALVDFSILIAAPLAKLKMLSRLVTKKVLDPTN